MPEWAQSLLTVGVTAIAAYAAIRVELRWLRRDLDGVESRVTDLETARFGHPRRRGSDFGRASR